MTYTEMLDLVLKALVLPHGQMWVTLEELRLVAEQLDDTERPEH